MRPELSRKVLDTKLESVSTPHPAVTRGVRICTASSRSAVSPCPEVGCSAWLRGCVLNTYLQGQFPSLPPSAGALSSS